MQSQVRHCFRWLHFREYCILDKIPQAFYSRQVMMTCSDQLIGHVVRVCFQGFGGSLVMLSSAKAMVSLRGCSLLPQVKFCQMLCQAHTYSSQADRGSHGSPLPHVRLRILELEF